MRIKIASRKSHLARLQSYLVAEKIQAKYPDVEIEFHFRESLGDINQADPLWKMPEKGVFTEDLRGDLILGKSDLIVHSWKDLPTFVSPETILALTLPRADARDLLLFKPTHRPPTLKILSSSPRRIYHLSKQLPALLPYTPERIEFLEVRGNIPTRIEKLLTHPDASGLILAKASLDRLLMSTHASWVSKDPQESSDFQNLTYKLRAFLEQLQWMVLPLTLNPPAAAQGALAVEIQSKNSILRDLLGSLQDQKTFEEVCAERERLKRYGGGCHQKIGIHHFSLHGKTVSIESGQLDSGETLNSCRLQHPIVKNPSFISEDDRIASADLELFERDSLNVSVPLNRDLYITHSEALPLNTAQDSRQIFWTAGLHSWKKLAKRGYWIHGSNESLGEQLPSHLDILLGKKPSWLTLTHEESKHLVKHQRGELLPTYKLVARDSSEVPSKKHYFWSSISQFMRALECNTKILHAQSHSSGPGHTYEFLKNFDRISKERVFFFLNEEDWKENLGRYI